MEKEDWNAVLAELLREALSVSGRGQVLVASSALDEMLLQLIKTYFHDDKNLIKSLIGVDRPLGTFSARINLAYAMGMLRKDQYDDLNLIRKIRNKCAHSFESISLDRDPLLSWVNGLMQTKICDKFKHEYIYVGGFDFLSELDDSPRNIFAKTFIHLMYGLFLRKITAIHIGVDSLKDMTRVWKEKSLQELQEERDSTVLNDPKIDAGSEFSKGSEPEVSE